jgi:hypothetical protein
MTTNFQRVRYGLGLEAGKRARWPKTTRGSNPTPYTNAYTVRVKLERPIRGVKQVTRHAQGDRASAAAAARPESIRPSHSF